MLSSDFKSVVIPLNEQERCDSKSFGSSGNHNFSPLFDLFKRRTVETGRLDKELTRSHLLFFNDKIPERLTVSKRRIPERETLNS